MNRLYLTVNLSLGTALALAAPIPLPGRTPQTWLDDPAPLPVWLDEARIVPGGESQTAALWIKTLRRLAGEASPGIQMDNAVDEFQDVFGVSAYGERAPAGLSELRAICGWLSTKEATTPALTMIARRMTEQTLSATDLNAHRSVGQGKDTLQPGPSELPTRRH